MGFISTVTPEKSNEPGKIGGIEQMRYFIDTEWCRRQGRSPAVVMRSRLCPSCRAGQVLDDEILASIKRCCSQTDGYLAPGQPLQEMAFRILLANGGQPLSLADILKELKLRSGVGSLVASAKVLGRVLSRDTFYGIRPAPAEPADTQSNA